MDSFHRSFERWLELESNYKDIFNSILCGGAAGIVVRPHHQISSDLTFTLTYLSSIAMFLSQAKTAIAPAERVKMSFQTTSDKFTLVSAIRRGIDMARKDGILSLWRGHSTTMLRVTPYAGLSYAFHDVAEKEMKWMLGVNKLPFTYKFLAGSIAGAGGTLCTYPLDVLRVRLALTPGSTWSTTLRQGGLFQGLLPTMLGIVPYSGTAWSVKSHIMDHYPFVETEPNGSSYRRPATILEMLVINALSGLVGQFVTYPLDIVRRRMQLARSVRGEPLPNMWKVLKILVETEGLRGLTKGFSLNIIKGPITLSLSFTTYDLLRKWSTKDESSHNCGRH